MLSLIQSWAHAFSPDPDLRGVAEGTFYNSTAFTFSHSFFTMDQYDVERFTWTWKEKELSFRRRAMKIFCLFSRDNLQRYSSSQSPQSIPSVQYNLHSFQENHIDYDNWSQASYWFIGWQPRPSSELCEQQQLKLEGFDQDQGLEVTLVLLPDNNCEQVSNGVEQGSRWKRSSTGKSSSKWPTNGRAGTIMIMIMMNMIMMIFWCLTSSQVRKLERDLQTAQRNMEVTI